MTPKEAREYIKAPIRLGEMTEAELERTILKLRIARRVLREEKGKK